MMTAKPIGHVATLSALAVTLAALIIALSWFSSAARPNRTECDSCTPTELANFLAKAILSQDVEKLRRLSREPSNFQADGALSRSVHTLLYDDNVKFGNGEHRISLSSILHGDFVTRVIPSARSQNLYIIYYIRSDFFRLAGDVDFSKRLWQESWQRGYHACKIQRVGSEWKVINSFCYAETGGPYQVYG